MKKEDKYNEDLYLITRAIRNDERTKILDSLNKYLTSLILKHPEEIEEEFPLFTCREIFEWLESEREKMID